MIYTENMLSLFPNRFRIYHSGMWIKMCIRDRLLNNIATPSNHLFMIAFDLSCQPVPSAERY